MMKTRMATGRCCCGEFCDDGESSWTDNFSGYSAGENLTPYGYLGDGTNPSESGGGIRPIRGVGQDVNYARRLFPYQWESVNQVSFELKILSDRGMFGLFGDAPFTGNLSDKPGLEWHSGDKIRMMHSSSSGTPENTTITRSHAVNDIFKIIVRNISYTYPSAVRVKIVGEVDYYHNGVLFSTKDYVKEEQKDWWCSRYYGTTQDSFIDCITDDWDFQIT